MSDIKLFHIQGREAISLPGTAFKLESDLQAIIESHMDVLLQMKFVASEHSTGKHQLEQGFTRGCVQYRTLGHRKPGGYDQIIRRPGASQTVDSAEF